MLTLSEYQLLNEGRVDVIFDKHYDRLIVAVRNVYTNRPGLTQYNPSQLKQFVSEVWKEICVDHDPSSNKQYVDWITRQFIGHPKRVNEDADRIKKALKLFDKYKQRLPVNQRDINHYKQYHDLETAVEQFESSEKGDYGKYLFANAKHLIDKSQLLYDDSTVKVVEIHTYEQSKLFGKDTKWCTAYTHTSQYFEDYTHLFTPLFVIIWQTGVRYQLHGWPMDVGMDLHDQDITQVAFDVQMMDVRDRDVIDTHLNHLLNAPAGKAIVNHHPQIGFTLGLRATNAAIVKQCMSKSGYNIREMTEQLIRDLDEGTSEENHLVMAPRLGKWFVENVGGTKYDF